MEILKKIILSGIFIITSLTFANAQSNTVHHNETDPNSSYKDRIPSSRKHRFKDSFNNKNAEDVSARNYKQQQRKKKTGKEPAYQQNFDRKQKPDTSNSKHPYGL